jgi:hypothetical protein
MSRWLKLRLTVLLLVLTAGGTAAADARIPIEHWLLAEELTTLGLARQDALMLTMAARLKLRHPGVLAPLPRGVAPGDGAAAVRPHPRSAQALLQRARALAQGQPGLLGLIDDVAQDRPRGMEDGPRLHAAQAAAGGTDIYREAFRPGETAAVLIAGDGESNLDLYVFDAGGRRICASEKLDDVEVCRWQPLSGGRHVIHVVNRGRAVNRYEMRSN